MSHPVTYEPLYSWRCRHCEAHGSFSRPAIETCDVSYERAVLAHAITSPECQRLHQDKGVAVEVTGATLPE